MPIQIEELTNEQFNMLDHMWSIESQEDFNEWYDGLNTAGRQQADILKYLLTMEIVEEMITNKDADCPNVKYILKEYML